VSLPDGTRLHSRAHPSRGRQVVRGLIAVLAVGLTFLLGIAFARTLDDRPSPGGTTTDVRTLTPLPQEAPVRTVTVTVTGP
jgi:hypothetical protein